MVKGIEILGEESKVFNEDQYKKLVDVTASILLKDTSPDDLLSKSPFLYFILFYFILILF